MDKQQVLRVGIRLEVMREGTQLVHYAKVEDVGIWEFAISALFGGHEADVLRPNETVECVFTDPRTQQQYGFKSVVLRREVRVVPLYFLSLPREYDRIQRRGFVRYPVLMAAQYRPIEDNRWSKGFLVDISGSGARLSHREALTSEDLQLTFALTANESPIVLKARVIRTEQVAGQGHTMYHTGVEFVEIPMGAQDRIVGYIFQRMLEHRRSQEW